MEVLEGLTSPILLVIAPILFFVLRKRRWSLLFKLFLSLSVLAIVSGLPVFVYRDGCTFWAYKSYSYKHPFGVSKNINGQVICTQSFTRDIGVSHFLLTDAAIVLSAIWAIRKVVKKFGYGQEGNQKK